MNKGEIIFYQYLRVFIRFWFILILSLKYNIKKSMLLKSIPDKLVGMDYQTTLFNILGLTCNAIR